MVPLAKRLTLIIAIPEATVENGSQALVPSILFIFGKRAVQHRLHSFLITLDNGIDIFRTAGTPLNLKDAHTTLHHAVDEAEGLQVLGRHDVLVVDFQLCTRLTVCHNIAATTNLHAGTTIGRATCVVKTHITLATNGHAECSMTEHLDANQFALRSTDVLLLYLTINLCYLVEIQLASQYHHISKLGIELQRLDVGDVQLGGKMHLHTLLSAIGHHRNIAGYDCRDLSLHSSIDNLVHQLDVLAIDNGVHRQIALHSMFLTSGGYLT